MQQNFTSTITKKHKACLSCGIIKHTSVFKKDGCTNCPFLEMKNHPDNVIDTTSDSYKGLVCIVHPTKSWVAQWQRINDKEKGIYAMIVDGVLPDEFINRLEEKGNVYYQRDKSFAP